MLGNEDKKKIKVTIVGTGSLKSEIISLIQKKN